ncbi:ABC-type multidrug transport system ATPase subunit [Variovorax paradoxus]|uniref:ABC-type multidrug transport system ATPase subunit n=1 Tax=Variovorax paradoxus TaxID=34073 RepID=A0AAE3Y5J8_VARPD|nr:ATP-binding cassette domain-containing protein [Variovorax paradoxus]MDP9965366.1 ABC-type multidrug transport system ATPase subunit [Variovorax paradoxus]MDR6429967.1 ABC-type multidrug transport system ATPase subunit [Variovorax paradoxus]
MNAPTSPAILQVHDLGFSYPGQPALASGWCASVGEGVTLLYGDTGSGKSALLRVIAGMLPASGRLTLAGARLDTQPEAYRRNVFFCDPATEAFDQVTARACTATLGEGDAGFDAAQWQALVEGFSLAPHIEKPMYMLSTGSKRKVWLAAALASGRPLVLLDEPEGALDARSIGCLWKAVAARAGRAGHAIVIASSARLDHVPQIPLAGCIALPLR